MAKKTRTSEGIDMSEEWKVHLPNLIEEIANNSRQPTLLTPLRITRKIIIQLGERAAQLNDPQLNAIMCRLTIYSISDPRHKDYDPRRVEKILKAGRKQKDKFHG